MAAFLLGLLFFLAGDLGTFFFLTALMLLIVCLLLASGQGSKVTLLCVDPWHEHYDAVPLTIYMMTSAQHVSFYCMCQFLRSVCLALLS